MARTYKLKSLAGDDTDREKIDFASLLNSQQLAAVTSGPGPSLVIAGAGSGKTRTLTYRVAYLLETGVPPQNILLLTFTNKAAREMLGRVREIVPDDTAAIWGGTFHSVGNRILRRHADMIGFTPAFSILDRDDQAAMLRATVKESGIDKDRLKDKRFPKAPVLSAVFSMKQNLDVEMDGLLEERYEHLCEYWEDMKQVFARYEDRKLECNSMDFDDLLCKTLVMLDTNAELREGYQHKFQAILVDEYQDTNPVQSRLIDLLASRHRHLMVVGDDAQSIYSWRGADYRNILGFPDRYEDSARYKIETNYRSTPEILNLANMSIGRNRYQFPKKLQSAQDPGDKPALVHLPDDQAQAHFVTQRIADLQEEGVPLEEIAVLYRAHFHSMDIQMGLTRLKIPFRITSGLRFFEQAHIKDIVAFMRLVVNPRDEVSFRRMVGMVHGIGDATATGLWNSWLASPACEEGPLPECYSDFMKHFKVPKRSKPEWEQLIYTMNELAFSGKPVKPASMVKSITEGFYADVMQTEYANLERRIQDLEQFGNYSESYDDTELFLSELALLSSVDTGGERPRDDEKKEEVVMSSIHQAKGLEWNHVFIVWLTEGMFPNRRAIEGDGIDSDGASVAEAIEEERRLFYVGVTRARKDLYLTYPLRWSTSKGLMPQSPSRFVAELPSYVYEVWDVEGDFF